MGFCSLKTKFHFVFDIFFEAIVVLNRILQATRAKDFCHLASRFFNPGRRVSQATNAGGSVRRARFARNP